MSAGMPEILTSRTSVECDAVLPITVSGLGWVCVRDRWRRVSSAVVVFAAQCGFLPSQQTQKRGTGAGE